MKKYMVICAPVSSRSGYGDHARDLVISFFKDDKYDIHIIDINWGDTPRNALDKTNPIHKKILDCFLHDNQFKKQPDIYVDIRIPNEFQQLGKFNIGITAGIETNAVSQKWIEGCNKMDLIIVPSEHSKAGFVKTLYDKMNTLQDGKQQKVGELKLEKPIEVLFEGVSEVFKPLKKDEISGKFFDMLDNKISETFAFLFVGLWGQGGFGEDRKDIGRLVKVFYESFANKKNKPALVLKTNGAGFSIMDREAILERINSIKNKFPSDWDLPNVYLLHGSLADKEMNYLYNHPKVKCMVSLTHGEGFGRPLLEATMTGLPVMASAWSGHLDFLSEDYSLLIGGTMDKVPESAVWEDIIISESQWFSVSENQVYKMLNHIYNNINEIKSNAKKLMKINRSKFTLENMAKKLNDTVDSYTENLSTQVGIKLPKLKKSSDNSKIKIPNLKRENA